MKELKVSIIAILIVCTIIISCSFAMSAHAEEEYPEFYPKLAVVVDAHVDGLVWLYTCVDKDGEEWSYWDEPEAWKQGDIINMMMFNNDPDYHNHEIIEIYHEGYAEDFETFLLACGWC